MKKIIFLLSLLLVLVGCSDSDTTEDNSLDIPDKYNVSGQVVNESGEGVTGIKINFSDGFGTATTVAGGKFSKTNLMNKVLITPVTDGFAFEPPHLPVTQETKDLKFVMFKSISSNLTGTIIDSTDSKIIKGVEIIVNNSTHSYIARTNDNGQFTLKNIETTETTINAYLERRDISKTQIGFEYQGEKKITLKANDNDIEKFKIIPQILISEIDKSGKKFRGKITNNSGKSIDKILIWITVTNEDGDIYTDYKKIKDLASEKTRDFEMSVSYDDDMDYYEIDIEGDI